MMNDRRRKRQILKVDHYDGQSIYSDGELFYELGGYLGGGAAGVVYEAYCARTMRHVAIKILNPVGYKLLPSTLLSRCIVAIKGTPLQAIYDEERSHPPRCGRESREMIPMHIENVWWLIHPTSKQAVAAYQDPHTQALRELNLQQCIDVWGSELRVDDVHQDDPDYLQLETATQYVSIKNQVFTIPKIPKKFIKFAMTRRGIHREITHMSGLASHENVLRLEEALEWVQDSKCTTFLVLELAAGGELFDRIKLDCGTEEALARRYIKQLLSGVAFCHHSGVCHRDLKPENLLLADGEEYSTLKIADFGLSAIFAMTEHGDRKDEKRGSAQVIRRLKSIVGSPHYVAPEVLMDMGLGYDGAKADAWSIGVIIYAMLAGNLPFGKDLLKCLRYEKFKKWCYTNKYSDELEEEEPHERHGGNSDDPSTLKNTEDTIFPSWFFPSHFSTEVKSLITQLLYPDPSMRLSVYEAQHHAWVMERSLHSWRQRSVPDPCPASSPPSLHFLDILNSPNKNHRALGVVAHAPLSNLDSDHQHRAPSPVSSPNGSINRFPYRLGIRSTSYNSISTLSPTSPLQPLCAREMLMNSRYMPSVDETAPLSGGQTPPPSPKTDNRGEITLFEMDTVQSTYEGNKQVSQKYQQRRRNSTPEVKGQWKGMSRVHDFELVKQMEALYSSTTHEN